MSRVLLRELSITNCGPIVRDEVSLEPYTYFVGRNNSGKSHYLRAIELLLATRAPTAEEIFELQNDKTSPIRIEGIFDGVSTYTSAIAKSNHKEAIEAAMSEGLLRVVRVLDSRDTEESVFGVRKPNGEIVNPSGFAGNLLKVLPEPISIVATADTSEELRSKGNTAIMKLKKEVLGAFLEQLKVRTKNAFAGLDEFLHSSEAGKRSADLASFERELRAELAGEFSDVVPSVEFELPNEEVIAQELQLYLDDGHRSLVEQKGHGLHRAALLALLRLLARQGLRYQERPAPIFLIGEIETFLHPYAQSQLAETLSGLVDRYQVVRTIHSPFIIIPRDIRGYRRVRKGDHGSKNVRANWGKLDAKEVAKHLEWRGNLQGLFADRIVLIEGSHDENFYEKLTSILDVPYPPRRFTLFAKTAGKKQLRVVRDFYLKMGFEDVAIVTDLDYLFADDSRHLLEELGLRPSTVEEFRHHIDWRIAGDPPLSFIREQSLKKGVPPGFNDVLGALAERRVFVLRHGAPEHYCKKGAGRKSAWVEIECADDLAEVEFLTDMMVKLLAVPPNQTRG